jgi:hypothetical protein
MIVAQTCEFKICATHLMEEHMAITKVTAPEHFEISMQDAHLLSITKYMPIKCVTCRVETHEKFVSSKVMMVMLNG